MRVPSDTRLLTNREHVIARCDRLGKVYTAENLLTVATKEVERLQYALGSAHSSIGTYCGDFCEARPADPEQVKCSVCPLYALSAISASGDVDV